MTCHMMFIGTAARLDAPNAPNANGRAIRDEKRNIHFMKVTTEYF